jgi:hypothetical protein
MIVRPPDCWPLLKKVPSPLTFCSAIDIGGRGLRYHRDITPDQVRRLCGYIRKGLQNYGDHAGFKAEEVAHVVASCLVRRCAERFDPARDLPPRPDSEALPTSWPAPDLSRMLGTVRHEPPA